MQSPGHPCIKLLISSLLESAKQQSQGCFEYEKLKFDRVWVQGTVKQKLGQALRLDDGTGSIQVLLPNSLAGQQDLGAECYALVVGKLVSPTTKSLPHIRAHKVVNLSADSKASSQRMLQWASEVTELQRKVYPLMAANAVPTQPCN